MPNTTIPKITFVSGSNTYSCSFATLPDNPTAYSSPRAGSEFIQYASGLEDAWIVGTDYCLEFDWRWIPTTNTTSPLATGWDDTGTNPGVRSFIEFARQKNTFKFYPDASGSTSYDSYLGASNGGDATTDVPTLEPNGYRMFHMIIRNPNSPYTGY